jgi:gentisate 1,2-dioxygenase
MTTIAAFIQLLPSGFHTAPYRSTDATVFVAVEGRGRTRIGADFVVEWQPRRNIAQCSLRAHAEEKS